MSPTPGPPGKGKTTENSRKKNQCLPGIGGGGKEMNRQSTEDFYDSENTLYGTLVMDTCHTFV